MLMLKRCRVIGCNACGPFEAHYCKNCKNYDVTHRSANCPTLLRKRCRVVGCNACGPNEVHYCKNCNTRDVDHRSSNCPTLQRRMIALCQPVGPVLLQSPLVVARPQSRDMSLSTGITASTVSVFLRAGGSTYVLVGLRGVQDSWYKKVCTFGGSIDRGESSEQAAIRETFEEGGVLLDRSKLHLFDTFRHFANYYYVFDSEPVVLGPRAGHEREIYKSDRLSRKFGSRMIHNSGHNTGLAWVRVSALLSSDEEFVKNSPSTKVIRRMREAGII